MESANQLHVSLIQTQIHWEDAEANRKMLSEKISTLEKTDIIILPEMFSTGFTNNSVKLAETMQGETHRWMQDLSKSIDVVICGSLIIEEGSKYFNRFLWVEPNGETKFYDKKHLFAMAGENEHFSSGLTKKIIQYKGWKINLQICYDLRFPVWTRRSTDEEKDYDLLIYVASWPVARVHAWSTLLKARAIENMSYCIGVNRVGTDGNGYEYPGASVVVNCLGEAIVESLTGKEEVLSCNIDYEHLTKVRKKLPFHKDQDQFKLL